MAVDVMVNLLKRCFPQEFPQWEGRIREMIPTYGIPLEKNPDLLKQVQASTAATLKLN